MRVKQVFKFLNLCWHHYLWNRNSFLSWKSTNIHWESLIYGNILCESLRNTIICSTFHTSFYFDYLEVFNYHIDLSIFRLLKLYLIFLAVIMSPPLPSPPLFSCPLLFDVLSLLFPKSPLALWPSLKEMMGNFVITAIYYCYRHFCHGSSVGDIAREAGDSEKKKKKGRDSERSWSVSGPWEDSDSCEEGAHSCSP